MPTFYISRENHIEKFFFENLFWLESFYLRFYLLRFRCFRLDLNFNKIFGFLVVSRLLSFQINKHLTKIIKQKKTWFFQLHTYSKDGDRNQLAFSYDVFGFHTKEERFHLFIQQGLYSAEYDVGPVLPEHQTHARLDNCFRSHCFILLTFLNFKIFLHHSSL